MSDGKVVQLRPPRPVKELLTISGRRILGVAFNPFRDKTGKASTRPVLWLDDGTRLLLVPEETTDGYGVRLERIPK